MFLKYSCLHVLTGYHICIGALYSRGKELETCNSLKGTTSTNYDHVKFNVKVSMHLILAIRD